MLQNRLKPNSFGEQEGDNGSGFLLRLKIPLSDSDALLGSDTQSPSYTGCLQADFRLGWVRLRLGWVRLGLGWVRLGWVRVRVWLG